MGVQADVENRKLEARGGPSPGLLSHLRPPPHQGVEPGLGAPQEGRRGRVAGGSGPHPLEEELAQLWGQGLLQVSWGEQFSGVCWWQVTENKAPFTASTSCLQTLC